MAFLTIPGFSKMSKQRIFNKAVAHIAITRVQSYSSDSGCRYSGTGCNAAPLLQEIYRHQADTYGPWNELVDMCLVPKNNAIFIGELQTAHDSCDHNMGEAFVAQWKENMTALAKRWNLSTSTLDKVPA